MPLVALTDPSDPFGGSKLLSWAAVFYVLAQLALWHHDVDISIYLYLYISISIYIYIYMIMSYGYKGGNAWKLLG